MQFLSRISVAMLGRLLLLAAALASTPAMAPNTATAEPIKQLPPVPELLGDAPRVYPRQIAPSAQSLQPTHPIPPMQPLKPGKDLRPVSPSLIVNSAQTPELIDTLRNPPKEPPMRKALHKAGYSSVLATLMLAAAAQADTPPTLADIAKQLDAITKRLDDIENGMKAPDGSAFAMKKMQDDLLALKKQMAELEKKTPVVSKSFNAEKAQQQQATAPRLTGTARVKFVNDWIEDVSVIVNGVGYEVMIGSELTIPVPAGSFTYQVLNLQRRSMTRTIESDKTWTVSINTRN